MRKSILLLFFLSFCNPVPSEKDIKSAKSKTHTLPVFSITIDEKYLYSADSGLFVKGTNGTIGPHGDTANYYQEWEFPCLATFHLSNDTIFSHQVGFRIKGNSSRNKPNKSIGLYWRQDYGHYSLKYKLFEDRDTFEFKRLKLRSGGSDQTATILNDLILSRWIQNKTHVPVLAGRPVVLYINNEYWGLYNLRELFSIQYFETYYSANKNFVNILFGSPELPGVEEGERETFMQEVLAFFKNNDLALTENYQIATTLLDIDNFVDYFIIETYMANWDWPANNMLRWRDETTINNQKWRFALSDLDAAFIKHRVNYLWLGEFYESAEDRIEFYQGGFFIFDQLMKNKEFRIRFFERYLYFIDEVFTTPHLTAIIDELVNEIYDEYPAHQERWPYYNSQQIWYSDVMGMKTFQSERKKWIRPLIAQWLNEAKSE